MSGASSVPVSIKLSFATRWQDDNGARKRRPVGDQLVEAVLGSGRQLTGEFLRFGAVGAIGFLVDTAVVYALRPSLGLCGAGLASYLAAATMTWLLNRSWTFRRRAGRPTHRQWAAYLFANLAGFVLNRGTFAALVTLAPFCAAEPVIAVAAGATVGTMVNFSLARLVVFR